MNFEVVRDYAPDIEAQLDALRLLLASKPSMTEQPTSHDCHEHEKEANCSLASEQEVRDRDAQHIPSQV